eukprot:scaffold4477_cov95-Phaeocystis_antarctica.AAC.2
MFLHFFLLYPASASPAMRAALSFKKSRPHRMSPGPLSAAAKPCPRRGPDRPRRLAREPGSSPGTRPTKPVAATVHSPGPATPTLCPTMRWCYTSEPGGLPGCCTCTPESSKGRTKVAVPRFSA